MPDGFTIRKLQAAIDRVQTLQKEAERDEGAQRLLEGLGRPGGLAELAASEAELEDHEISYLGAFPPRLVEAVRAVLHSAAQDDNPPFITLQYLPAYEFEVRFIEYADQLTIHLRGPFAEPYPRDSFQLKR